MCPSCGLYQVVFPGLLLQARFFDRNRANLGQIERLRLGWSLEEVFGLALGFVLLGAQPLEFVDTALLSRAV